MNAPDTLPQGLDLLHTLFAENRAEWASTHLGELFVEPAYFRKLETLRPCFLVGGRGTGKTTSLQSLRFDATHSRLTKTGLAGGQSYFGILVRMNKNRVRAFRGASLEDERWAALFAHYFNLLVCLELITLAEWLESRCEKKLTQSSVELVAKALGLGFVSDLKQLRAASKKAVVELELHVNNPSAGSPVLVSIAEAPLRQFVDALRDGDLLGPSMLFCCIDEYENLLDYQQSVLNTYIKHAEPPLSYKVGVRKNGIRSTQTLDGQDQLRTPDDYAEIEIADEGFEHFARAVAELRLKIARDNGVPVPLRLKDYLEDLSLEQEASLLGADKIADRITSQLGSAPESMKTFLASRQKLELCLLEYWREANPELTLIELAQHWYENPSLWATRYGNYGFASLFWLSKGNKGARIRKYYCGERELLALASGNIRYFLELLEGALSQYRQEQLSEIAEDLRVSAKAQTLAARDVGARRLNQLDGADHGVQLKRLVLAIGKVFFELARAPNGKTPEVTSFVLSGSPAELEEVSNLLSEGVGHLAFEVSPRTKATSKLEMRDDEYRLHPIFSAFFEISHRRKRRMTFRASDLLAVLGDRPNRAISELLGSHLQIDADELPEQLAFFSAFYSKSDDDQEPQG